jgi:hypothetical protein
MIGARWFLYALIGAVSTVLIVFGWGYMKGYNSAEATYQRSMNKALQEQYEQMMAQSQREKALALKALEKKYALRKKISAVPKPVDSCELPTSCLQWYDDIVRAAAPSGSGAD